MDYDDVPLMRVSHLNKRFGEGCPHCRNHSVKLQGNYYPKCGTVYARRDVSFDVYDGEILGVVGENSSGKFTMIQCLYFDQEVTGGSCTICIYKNGVANIFEPTVQQQRYIRNHVLDTVYQNPYLGLKMNFSSMGNIAEKSIAAGKRSVKAMSECGEELLNAMKIPVYRTKGEPRKLFGGMQQRAQIAKAPSNNPPILLLDEATTGLNLPVQANVLDLIKKIQRELGISMLVALHDLGVIRMLADRTIAMSDGEIIEQGLTDRVMEGPQHPYTQQLVYSLL